VTSIGIASHPLSESDHRAQLRRAVIASTGGHDHRMVRFPALRHRPQGALVATLLLTCLATFAVGFVPTYDQVGIWGAVVLTIIRFIQGVGSAANRAARYCCRWNGADECPSWFYHVVSVARRSGRSAAGKHRGAGV
jgi:MFS family permease